jgi:hypothetical protein
MQEITPDFRHIHWKAAINVIIFNASLTGNKTKLTLTITMIEFIILKYLKVDIHPPKEPTIKEVFWPPPLSLWIKGNIDGVSCV